MPRIGKSLIACLLLRLYSLSAVRCVDVFKSHSTRAPVLPNSPSSCVLVSGQQVLQYNGAVVVYEGVVEYLRD